MKKRIGFGAELTLLELIIVIGLFAIFATLDLRIFAAAKNLEAESDRLSHAVIAAGNAAECFKAGLEPDLYYDEAWLPVDKANAMYVVSIEGSSHGDVRAAKISVSDKTGEIFALMAKAPEVQP